MILRWNHCEIQRRIKVLQRQGLKAACFLVPSRPWGSYNPFHFKKLFEQVSFLRCWASFQLCQGINNKWVGDRFHLGSPGLHGLERPIGIWPFLLGYENLFFSSVFSTYVFSRVLKCTLVVVLFHIFGIHS